MTTLLFDVVEGPECPHTVIVEDIAQGVRDRARRILERDGYHQSIAVILSRGPNGGLAPTAVSPKTRLSGEEAKDGFVTAIRRIIQAHDTVAVITISEAWTLRGKAAAEWLDNATSGPIKAHPDRVEILGVTIEERSKTTAWRAVILRDGGPDGPPHLGPWTQLDGVLAGRFCEFLKETP